MAKEKISADRFRARLDALKPRDLRPGEGTSWSRTAAEYDAERHATTQALLRLNIEVGLAVLEKLAR